MAGADTRKWRRYLNFWRANIAADVDAELAFHVDARMEELTTGGLDAAADMRLHALARSHDVDVRAAALAALHLASGSERGTRRMLASALRAEGDHDLAVRSRWAIALGYMGDRFAATGDPAAALTAYDRALDVRPSSPALLMSRANAQRDAGDLTGAIASYQSSLAIDRSNSLAWVNFGIALATARECGAVLPTAAIVDQLMHAVSLAGHGSDDHSALLTEVERLARHDIRADQSDAV